MQPSTALVVMAKQPLAGSTKTRLCPPFSPEQAAAFSEALLLDTFDLAGSLVGSLAGLQLAAAITPAASQPYFEKVSPPGTILLAVDGADIGQCLSQSFEALFQAGFKKVIALNADGPSLPHPYLLQAIDLLDENDGVIGPGEDGGYYLVGLINPCPQLFQDIEWSTPRVLEQTLARLHALGLRTTLTPPWYDVDTVQEAQRIFAELQQLPLDRLIHTRRFFENLQPGEWPI